MAATDPLTGRASSSTPPGGRCRWPWHLPWWQDVLLGADQEDVAEFQPIGGSPLHEATILIRMGFMQH